MHKGFLRTAALLGAITVAMGALAAHRLKTMIGEHELSIFDTGVRYQFYHVFALALAGILWKEYPNRWMKAAGQLFILGIIFFSGSLYLLTYITAAKIEGMNWVGPVTPIGGVFFIAGWICLLLGVQKVSKG